MYCEQAVAEAKAGVVDRLDVVGSVDYRKSLVQYMVIRRSEAIIALGYRVDPVGSRLCGLTVARSLQIEKNGQEM